ncbi:PadR family transcriptional regulator [Desulfosporosinus nitroreducens]|uniref:PadR family transcriptional regulator n=1 Tax=Desulfosporosinus nitroreducens TaxID=2018668 RepID=UPI00207C717B|nr:PadR family transcriptional regulator [Desulfosporosinus nitroreducens]MCO1604707.1 PadR family transcriptional regulator [Desulfosporosinus nitroreducens]
MLEFIILGFLMCGETSGYDLKQWMTKSTSYFFDASFGSIYPALKRLGDKQLVIFKESVEGSKYKKVYQITETGKEAFMKWIAEPIAFEKSKQDHLVKIFFYEFLPKEKAIANLKGLIEVIQPIEKNLIGQKEEASQKYDVYQFYYRYATMVYGIDYYRFIMSWCNDMITKLETDTETIRSERFNTK